MADTLASRSTSSCTVSRSPPITASNRGVEQESSAVSNSSCSELAWNRNITSNKWNELNEWGFMPPLCTCGLNWARRTSWGCWDEWDDTALQTQNLKFKPWRSEVEYATSRSRRLPTILNFYEWEIFRFFKTWIAEWGSNPRSPTFQAGSLNHCTSRLQLYLVRAAINRSTTTNYVAQIGLKQTHQLNLSRLHTSESNVCRRIETIPVP